MGSPDRGTFEKPEYRYDETPIARGVSVPAKVDDVEQHRRGSRKLSVVQSIKENYGLAEASSVRRGHDSTHRKLKPRHIQLIGIGGTIGTALYVQIGRGLMQGGPGSLFIAFTFWCTFILCVNNCMAEMVSWTPISSPFIRFAGRYVDEAFGFAAGWNFFVFEAALVPFEVVACNFIINFWTDAIPTGAVIAVIVVLYAAINLFAVKWYGESEFWLAMGKVLLILGLIAYTFITMLGGNPLNDRYGFRFWQNPGAFAEWYTTGDTGRFLGFMQCLTLATFTIAGPDYVSMAAGEAENPRAVLPQAYRAVFYRLTFFFVLGALCVGIVVPYNDPTMIAAFESGAHGAAASPYVISMLRLSVPVLPHIVNALVLSSALSAGNSYVYCASRSLFGLALEGKAPKILTKCTKNGVPIYCVAVVLAISLLSFLQVSNSASQVLQWFVNLVTASQLLNFAVMSLTYLHFHRAVNYQGIDRRILPYHSFLQPYSAWYALTGTAVMALLGGYAVFLPGRWDTATFFFSYTMVGVVPLLFLGYKVVKKTKWLGPAEVDLQMKDVRDEIDEYERNYVPVPPRNVFEKYFDKLFG